MRLAEVGLVWARHFELEFALTLTPPDTVGVVLAVDSRVHTQRTVAVARVWGALADEGTAESSLLGLLCLWPFPELHLE